MSSQPKGTLLAPDQLDPTTTAVIAVLSARWSVPVLRGLADGHVRFNELQRHLAGVSHKVLIATLRMLQREGFVQGPLTDEAPRRSYREVIEYQLTAAGHDLLALTAEIQQWALSNGPSLDRARRDFARRWSALP